MYENKYFDLIFVIRFEEKIFNLNRDSNLVVADLQPGAP